MKYLLGLSLRFHDTLNRSKNIDLNLTMYIMNHSSILDNIKLKYIFTKCKQNAPIKERIPFVVFDNAIFQYLNKK